MASKACCEIPPVTHDYTPKGTYVPIGPFKTYTSGLATSPTGILMIYDIFSYSPQILQGADILASAGTLVVMPDLFKGASADPNCYPPDTPEKAAALSAFINGPANPAEARTNVLAVAELLVREHPGVKKWGVIGYCLGGKVAVCVSGEGSPFAASVQAHPAMMDAEEFSRVRIPHLVLPSRDEPADAVEAYRRALNGHTDQGVRASSSVEVHGDMAHGWMAARANLKDEAAREGYEKGYRRVVEFFRDNLGV